MLSHGLNNAPSAVPLYTEKSRALPPYTVSVAALQANANTLQAGVVEAITTEDYQNVDSPVIISLVVILPGDVATQQIKVIVINCADTKYEPAANSCTAERANGRIGKHFSPPLNAKPDANPRRKELTTRPSKRTQTFVFRASVHTL
jgi:hypothetical protein